MDSQQSVVESSTNLKSLLCKSQQEDFLQVKELDFPVEGEVTVTTTEASLSDVISSSLQAVDGPPLIDESEEPCEDVECEAGEGRDSCGPSGASDSVKESKSEELPQQSSEAGLAESVVEKETWHGLIQRKRSLDEDTETTSFQPEFPVSSSLQSSFIPTLSQRTLPPPTTTQAHTLTPIPPPTNTNNSNSCDPSTHSPSLPPTSAVAVSSGEAPRKRAKMMKHGQIEVTLEGKNLWDEFYRRGTEMIVNRLGRRMFPGFAVAVNGLKPKAKYSMKVEMILADNHRFKFLNGRWLAVGNAEPQPLSETYMHPDSPNTGAFWMRHGVSFRKLKITNNKEKPGSNALIHSMHKYYLRLIIDEEFKAPAGQKIPPTNILQMDFPETSFIAVTAYQNEEVTQLKITNNPFAKAFRENGAEMDWEMMYHQSGMYSPSMHPDLYGNMMQHGGMWPPQSPMLPPTPLSSTLPPYSPLTGLSPNQGVMGYPGQYQYSTNMTPTAFPGASGSVPGAGGYFQWPQSGGHPHRNTATSPATSQALSTMAVPVSAHSNQLSHQDSYEQYHVPQQYTGSTIHPPSSHHLSHGSTLPDFDSAFTASIGHS